LIIRNAEIEDAEQLIALLDQLGYPCSLDQLKNRLQAYARDLHQVIVATESESIIGFITFVCYELFVHEGRCMHIESMVIDAQHRGKGIGKKLLQFAEDYAKTNNCKIIELITRNRRKEDGTHTFYERMGYEDHLKSNITYFSKEK
jgi:GNAT superfamily N-acetyltransferase